MSDKLEALSQPIGYVGTNCKNSVASGNLGYIKPNDAFGESPVYSQEYVTALLAAVEEKDQEIARLLELVDKYTDYGTQQRLRAETAEQRLQQPIKLPDRYSVDCGVCPDPNGDFLSHNDVIAALKEQGYQIEDE
jgi:hypothetical protein